MDSGLAARWFDGRSSRAQPVSVRLVRGPAGLTLELQPTAGDAAVLRLQKAQVGWPEMWGARARHATGPIVLDLREHGSLEIDDQAGWREAWAGAGGVPTLAERMQTRWRWLALGLCVSFVLLWSFYRWGTPWAAAWIAGHVPASMEREFGTRVLQELDAKWLKPSALPPPQRAALKSRFDGLARQVTPDLRRYPAFVPAFELQFRRGIGPNAFALPGGTIVMSDEMVQLAGPDGEEALLGVLAHEIGHGVHRHTTRIVVEQGVLNVGLGLAMGDVSAVVSLAAATLTGLAYSRSHETEADCFAVALMGKAGLPTAPMAQLLLDAERLHRGKQAGSPDPVESFLSSHPATAERAEMLKTGRAQGCR